LNVKDKIEAARDILGLANRFYEEWKEQAQHLSRLALRHRRCRYFSRRLSMLTRAYQSNRSMLRLAGNGKSRSPDSPWKGQENPKINGTAWQAYNGVCEYADYQKQYRSERKDAGLTGPGLEPVTK